jgi:hypothetical protein
VVKRFSIGLHAIGACAIRGSWSLTRAKHPDRNIECRRAEDGALPVVE